jgi:hypothetical protein
VKGDVSRGWRAARGLEPLRPVARRRALALLVVAPGAIRGTRVCWVGDGWWETCLSRPELGTVGWWDRDNKRGCRRCILDELKVFPILNRAVGERVTED